MVIVSNFVPRRQISWYELTESQREYFDYIEGEDRTYLRFIVYRGEPIDLEDWYGASVPSSYWDSAQSDSFFSGNVIKYISDDEGFDDRNIVIGTYCCISNPKGEPDGKRIIDLEAKD